MHKAYLQINRDLVVLLRIKFLPSTSGTHYVKSFGCFRVGNSFTKFDGKATHLARIPGNRRSIWVTAVKRSLMPILHSEGGKKLIKVDIRWCFHRHVT